MEVILFWNQVALEAHRRDFSREEGKRPEVGGPTRVSRALAIVHAAIYNAQEAAAPRTPGAPSFYTPMGLVMPPAPPAALNAAMTVAGAAVAVLKKLWPAQTQYIEGQLQAFCDQRLAPPWSEPSAGLMPALDHGELIGLALYELRQGDGHERPDDRAFVSAPDHHRPDPMSPDQGRLSTHWGRLKPFLIPVGAGGVVQHTAYLGPPPTRATTPARYTASVVDVALLGHAQERPGGRNPEQSTIGIFWGYDGSRELGVPPRLYNQVVVDYVKAQSGLGVGLSDAEAAHLFLLVNIAMADAAIVAWGAKYHYDLWRPVVGIREDAMGCGPNHGSAVGLPPPCDPNWVPLGIPRTNSPGEFYRTPDFPAYPSGHATFGAAAFRVAARFFAEKKGSTVGDELKLKFDFVSDEYSGKNKDPRGDQRTLIRKSLSLGQAIVDNAVSRVYLGVHWRFDGLGVVAPDLLEGTPLPLDPATPDKLSNAVEKKLGGVAAGLKVAEDVWAARP